MKLQFDSELADQKEAIDAVVSLFEGKSPHIEIFSEEILELEPLFTKIRSNKHPLRKGTQDR